MSAASIVSAEDTGMTVHNESNMMLEGSLNFLAAIILVKWSAFGPKRRCEI